MFLDVVSMFVVHKKIYRRYSTEQEDPNQVNKLPEQSADFTDS